MRNIKVQVKSFDSVPRLSPELHRKPVRGRELRWSEMEEFRRRRGDFRWSGREGEAHRCFWQPSDELRWPETWTVAATATRTVTGTERLDEEEAERGEKGREEEEEGGRGRWWSWSVMEGERALVRFSEGKLAQ